MSLNTWMICGLALYVCFVIYVGFLGAKKIKGLSDFAVAGESMGPIPLGLAFAASFFSAATFMGYVGFCYAWGSTGMWIFLAIFCASTLGFILLAKGVRNSNVELKSISMADWLAKRYNSDVLRGLCSIVFIIQIFYIAGQFSAGGSLLSGMIDGLDYTTAIIGVTIITVLYVTVGGLFADVHPCGPESLLRYCNQSRRTAHVQLRHHLRRNVHRIRVCGSAPVTEQDHGVKEPERHVQDDLDLDLRFLLLPAGYVRRPVHAGYQSVP